MTRKWFLKSPGKEPRHSAALIHDAIIEFPDLAATATAAAHTHATYCQ